MSEGYLKSSECVLYLLKKVKDFSNLLRLEIHIYVCERKKLEERESRIREVAEAKTETQIWEIVNKGRKKWRGIEGSISLNEWREFFKGLLERWRKERKLKGGEEKGIMKEQ